MKMVLLANQADAYVGLWRRTYSSGDTANLNATTDACGSYRGDNDLELPSARARICLRVSSSAPRTSVPSFLAPPPQSVFLSDFYFHRYLSVTGATSIYISLFFISVVLSNAASANVGRPFVEPRCLSRPRSDDRYSQPFFSFFFS